MHSLVLCINTYNITLRFVIIYAWSCAQYDHLLSLLIRKLLVLEDRMSKYTYQTTLIALFTFAFSTRLPLAYAFQHDPFRSNLTLSISYGPTYTNSMDMEA